MKNNLAASLPVRALTQAALALAVIISIYDHPTDRKKVIVEACRDDVPPMPQAEGCVSVVLKRDDLKDEAKIEDLAKFFQSQLGSP